MKLLEEIWTDQNISQNDSSVIAGNDAADPSNEYKPFLLENALKALNFNSDSERNFTERLSVSLGFVKVRRSRFSWRDSSMLTGWTNRSSTSNAQSTWSSLSYSSRCSSTSPSFYQKFPFHLPSKHSVRSSMSHHSLDHEFFPLEMIKVDVHQRSNSKSSPHFEDENLIDRFSYVCLFCFRSCIYFSDEL